MTQLLNRLAKTLSVVLYPLFVPTYGIALFCYAYSLHVAPLAGVWVAVAVIGTFILTCLLPITAIWIMMKKGDVKDLNIDNPRERTIPYLYSALGFGFWSYLLVHILHAPVFISCVAIGATLAIGLVAIINHWWKISAHLTGLGGLVGGVLTYCLGLGAYPTWGTLCLFLGLSWLLMWARLYLDAHTAAQVCTGWLLGMICTFVPYCIFNYAL
jgi:hypothetical protein